LKHHFYLIINSNSGSGNGQQLGQQLIAMLEEKNETYTPLFTKKAGDEATFALKLAESVLIPFDKRKTYTQFPLLVVLGGDGTLSHVVNALAQYPNVPIAYIPAGSGNDFSRAAGIYTRDIQQALSHILNTQSPTRLHVLEVLERNRHISRTLVNSFGIGIDGAVNRHISQSTLKERLNRLKLGSLVYPLTVVNVLFHQASFTATIQTEQERFKIDDIFLLTTTNHPYFGGGIKIVPKADLNEEAIDVIVIQKKSWWHIFQIILKLMAGKHLEHPDVHHFQSKSIKVQVEEPQHAQVDGELQAFQPFNLKFKQSSRYFWL